MQLLGLGWAGTSGSDVREMADALVREQRSDGGWAQIVSRGSDAFATGQVLGEASHRDPHRRTRRAGEPQPDVS